MLFDILFSIHAWMILAILAGAYLLRSRHRQVFPIINSYPGDFLGRRAYREYLGNTKNLITEGLAKHQGPITITNAHKQKIVLPASLTSWVKSNKDLDHKELVKEDFFAGYPVFEALTVLHASDEMIMGVIRAKLGQNDSTMPAMNASLARALQTLWGDDKDWHTINWHKDTTGIIARAASSVFVGPEKADDIEWLDIVQGYVGAYFAAVGELHKYPAWFRSIAIWFLPNATACRKYVTRARAIMNEVLSQRQQDAKKAELEGRQPPECNDALAWAQTASGGKTEAGDVQLSLAMAALFTTSELFRQILVDLASHPDLIEPLRNEVSQQISAHGISVAATYNMVLLDSVMKESQRMAAGSVVLERVALKDIKLPDGKLLPRGSHIMVDSTDLWNPTVYPNPDQFDGYRFLRKREEGDKFSQFVQSGPDYSVFGGGRHLCPGRFFANNELKLALAHILIKYDVRLANGDEPKPLQHGFYQIVNPSVELEVRRRDGAKEDILLP